VALGWRLVATTTPMSRPFSLVRRRSGEYCCASPARAPAQRRSALIRGSRYRGTAKRIERELALSNN
jgi:hypothetical protein